MVVAVREQGWEERHRASVSNLGACFGTYEPGRGVPLRLVTSTTSSSSTHPLHPPKSAMADTTTDTPAAPAPIPAKEVLYCAGACTTSLNVLDLPC
jgi:hypothetical protein